MTTPLEEMSRAELERRLNDPDVIERFRAAGTYLWDVHVLSLTPAELEADRQSMDPVTREDFDLGVAEARAAYEALDPIARADFDRRVAKAYARRHNLIPPSGI